MAREWLLRGVDPEELKATPTEEAPMTPRSRWENFWYHHKLKFWLCLFAVVVLVVVVVQAIKKDDPDYRVLLLTEQLYSEADLAALETLLESYGEDLDGDGKVEIRVENCQYGPHVEQSRNSGIQQVQAHLVAADRMFFMMEPDAYEYFIRTLSRTAADGEEFEFFAPIDGEETVWDWAGDTRPIAELQKRAPSLYFGVRATKGTAGKATDLYEQSMKLLENFINDEKGEKVDSGTASTTTAATTATIKDEPLATVTGDEMTGTTTTTATETSLNKTETTTQGSSGSATKGTSVTKTSATKTETTKATKTTAGKKDYLDTSKLTGTQEDVGKVVGYSSLFGQEVTVIAVYEGVNGDGQKYIETILSDCTATCIVECEYCHEMPCPDGGGKLCSHYDVKLDASETCQHCGLPKGDGHNGTCHGTIDWDNGGMRICHHYD